MQIINFVNFSSKADIVFDELDKGFWQGIMDLRRRAKRPIILTANRMQFVFFLILSRHIVHAFKVF